MSDSMMLEMFEYDEQREEPWEDDEWEGVFYPKDVEGLQKELAKLGYHLKPLTIQELHEEWSDAEYCAQWLNIETYFGRALSLKQWIEKGKCPIEIDKDEGNE